MSTNLYLHFKTIWYLVTSSMLSSKRQYLVNKGIADPLPLNYIPKDALVISSTIPEADFPMDRIPSHVRVCGPLTINLTPAEELEEISGWLTQAPTILINVGSMFQYNEQRAFIMAEAIAQLLGQLDFQVLWKFDKLGNYSDHVFTSV
jgi:hypothetical protein